MGAPVAGAPVAGATGAAPVADPTDAPVAPRSSLQQLFDALRVRRQPSQQPSSEEGRLAQQQGPTRLATLGPSGQPEEYALSQPATSREERESSVERATQEQKDKLEQDESAILDGYDAALKDNERWLEESNNLTSSKETSDSELDR